MESSAHIKSSYTLMDLLSTMLNIWGNILKSQQRGQAWWYTPLIPRLGRQMQADLVMFKASMDYIRRHFFFLKNPAKNISSSELKLRQ